MSRLFLSSASNGLYPHDYDVSSVVSMDFGELVPIMNVETVPTDDFKTFSGKGALRLQPQIFPTFGKAFVKSAAFFVPEHQLYEDADAFHQNQNMYKGKYVYQPHFSSLSFPQWLISGVGYVTLYHQEQNPNSSTAPTPDKFDFVWPSMENNLLTYNYFKLTREGQRLYKIYKMLGYDFPSFPYDASLTTASAVVAYGNYQLPAVSLLAYCKVYVDMFLSGTFYNYSEQVALLHAIRDKDTYVDSSSNTLYDATTGEISDIGLSRLLNVLLPHESSMYTQAWNNLNSPSGLNTGSELKSEMPSGLVSPVIGSFNSTTDIVFANATSNALENHLSSDLTGISSIGLRFLQSFDRFVRRWNLSGTKSVQKVYAQFGIKSDDFNSHFVHKLYEGSSKIDFSPVLSNADTGNSGKTLGDYAGFGVSGLDINFNYKCSDYGMIIVVSWLQIVPMLSRGIDPMNLKRFPQDYYTPEFDGKAYRAIPQCEVSVNRRATDNITFGKTDGAVYGFTNIYDEYRYLRDRIGGEFITDKNVAQNFLLSRDLSVIREVSSTPLKPQTDDIHYWDREDNPDVTNPFQTSWSNGDRFYLYVDWNIHAERPMLSDSESFDLGTGDIQIQKNGDMMS